jgi:hypothetical protein
VGNTEDIAALHFTSQPSITFIQRLGKFSNYKFAIGLYGYENWTLTLEQVHRSTWKTSEENVLRKMFGRKGQKEKEVRGNGELRGFMVFVVYRLLLE